MDRPASRRVRLAFYGHSGSGKSTVAGLTERRFTADGRRVARLKLAEPLYQMQQRMYGVAGRAIGHYEQDQELLESIASHLRRISPTSLIDDFERRLAACEADVVINDDVRDPTVDGPRLASLGFVFVRITCAEAVRVQRLDRRGDLATVRRSTTTSQLDLLPRHAVIDNSGDLDDLEPLVDTLAGVHL